MKNLFEIGFILVLVGIAIVAISTTTTTGLYICVSSFCAAMKMVMDRYDVRMEVEEA